MGALRNRPETPMASKPNIVLILADDIGWFDVGAYNRGIMGGPTPNIDRIAHEGVLATTTTARQAAPPAGRPSSRGRSRCARG